MVEMLLLLLAFLILYVFAPDIIPVLKDAETADVAKPLQSLFLFFRWIMELFTHLTAVAVLYLIGAGVIVLNGRRS